MSGSRSDREPVGVIGAGYVGLVTAACLASLGHRVWVHDINKAKIEALREGRSPIYEPGLEEMLAQHAERLSYTLDSKEVLGSAELVFVCVDTPPTPSGDADLSSVIAVVQEIAALGRDSRHVIVMKSTVPVGTGQRIMATLRAGGLGEVGYVSNPEFLREGTAISDFLRPDRVVIGDREAEHGDRVAAQYEPLGTPIVRTTVPSAEMIKYASNAFLATKISFINEIANVCEEVGADVEVVAHGMGLDRRIGPHFLRAGLGYGGSCFPKDVTALKQLAGNSGYHFQLLTAVVEVNELQKRRVVAKLKKHLGSLDGREICLLGLTFKPGTDDMREAASLVLAPRLIAEGATVRAYDPVAGADARALLPGVTIQDTVASALEGADAAVLLTEWPVLVNMDWFAARQLMRQPIIVDGRNALPAAELRAMGYTVDGIGRPTERSTVSA